MPVLLLYFSKTGISPVFIIYGECMKTKDVRYYLRVPHP
jgi:hypothetical protein